MTSRSFCSSPCSSDAASSIRREVLRVARTLADLEDEEQVRAPHVAEAMGFRVLDRVGQARATGQGARL